MIKYSGSITDIKGILVGNASDPGRTTGVTAVLAEKGAVCGVDVRGSAPGTRETALLGQAKTVDTVHCIMLCGGSAFGLDAAGGAMKFLEEKGCGFKTPFATVPIVPACAIYDLDYVSPDVRPDGDMGYAACKAAAESFTQGSFGAGTGATVGKIMGPDHAQKSGVGTSSIDLGDGIMVASIAVVNAFGDIYDGNDIIAGASDDSGYIDTEKSFIDLKPDFFGTNTTIGVIATNAKLTKDEATKLAQMGNNGICSAVRPSHTVFDGDTVFGLSCGDRELPLAYLTAAAQETFRRSVVNAVLAAESETER